MAYAAKSLLISALLLSAPAQVGAEEVKTAKEDATAEASLSPVSVFDANEQLDIVDVAKIYRQIGDFVIDCDYRLSTKKYACGVSATMQIEGGIVSISFLSTQSGQIITNIAAPADLDVDKGFVLLFDHVAKIIPASDWRCSQSGCGATIPFSGTYQVGVLRANKLAFTLNQKAKTELVSGSFDTSSLKVAFDIAARGPFQTVTKAESTVPKPQTKPSLGKSDKTANSKPGANSISSDSKPKNKTKINADLRASQP